MMIILIVNYFSENFFFTLTICVQKINLLKLKKINSYANENLKKAHLLLLLWKMKRHGIQV